MAKAIAAVYGKRLRLTKLFNPAIRFGGRFVGIINKVFGNMAYEKEMSAYWEYQYCVADFMESIKRTEGKL